MKNITPDRESSNESDARLPAGVKRSLSAPENCKSDSYKKPEAIGFLAGTNPCRRIAVPHGKPWIFGRKRPARVVLPAARCQAICSGHSPLLVPNAPQGCRTLRSTALRPRFRAATERSSHTAHKAPRQPLFGFQTKPQPARGGVQETPVSLDRASFWFGLTLPGKSRLRLRFP